MSRIAPTFPTTQNTPNSISVTTASGFNQGDLVYFSGNDYKSPANVTAPSTVNFAANQQQMVYSGGITGAVSPVFSATDYQTSNNSYGSSINQGMAVLTNGNIVQVFRSYNLNYPSFRIVNSAGTVVVATTTISTSSPFVTAGNNISVVALVGGGFAVMFNTSAGNPAYAVYTNTGSVTTAATSDALSSGSTSSQTIFQMTPLANGGFAVMVQSTAGNNQVKIYKTFLEGSC